MGRLFAFAAILVVASCTPMYIPESEHDNRPLFVQTVRVNSTPIDSFVLFVPTFKGRDTLRFTSYLTEPTDQLKQIWTTDEAFVAVFAKRDCEYAVVSKNGRSIDAWLRTRKCDASMRSQYYFDLFEWTGVLGNRILTVDLYSDDYVIKTLKIDL